MIGRRKERLVVESVHQLSGGMSCSSDRRFLVGSQKTCLRGSAQGPGQCQGILAFSRCQAAQGAANRIQDKPLGLMNHRGRESFIGHFCGKSRELSGDGHGSLQMRIVIVWRAADLLFLLLARII